MTLLPPWVGYPCSLSFSSLGSMNEWGTETHRQQVLLIRFHHRKMLITPFHILLQELDVRARGGGVIAHLLTNEIFDKKLICRCFLNVIPQTFFFSYGYSAFLLEMFSHIPVSCKYSEQTVGNIRSSFSDILSAGQGAFIQWNRLYFPFFCYFLVCFAMKL